MNGYLAFLLITVLQTCDMMFSQTMINFDQQAILKERFINLIKNDALFLKDEHSDTNISTDEPKTFHENLFPSYIDEHYSKLLQKSATIYTALRLSADTRKLLSKISENEQCFTGDNSSLHFLVGEGFLHSQNDDELLCLILILSKQATKVMQKNARGETPLHVAANYRNVLALNLLIKLGADVDAKNNFHETPLHNACAKQCLKSAEILLRAGANISALTNNDATPLHALSETSEGSISDEDLSRWMDLLKENLHRKNREGYTALHVASRKDNERMVRSLLMLNAEKDKRNGAGETPLHAACRAHSFKAFLVLVAHGADTQVRDKKRNTLLHTLVRSDEKETDKNDITKIILQLKADINVQNSDGDTPLHVAAGAGNAQLVDIFCEMGATRNARNFSLETPVHRACSADNLSACMILINRQIDRGVKDQRGNTPLHMLARRNRYFSDANLVQVVDHFKAYVQEKNELGDTALHDAATANGSLVVTALVSSGANVNDSNLQLETPLHKSCTSNDFQVCAVLIELGADIAARDRSGNFALKLVLERKWYLDEKESIENLMGKLRAEICSTKESEYIPLFYALDNDLLQLGKVGRGSDSDNYRERILKSEILLELGANPDVQDREGASPLHRVVRAPCSALTELLLKKGANVFIVDHLLNTPLHYVCDGSGNLLSSENNVSYEQEMVARLLLRHGAPINAKNVKGNPPLFQVVMKANTRVTECLLKKGAKVDQVNRLRQNLLHIFPSHKLLQKKGYRFAFEQLGLDSDSDFSNLGFAEEEPRSLNLGSEMAFIKILVQRLPRTLLNQYDIFGNCPMHYWGIYCKSDFHILSELEIDFDAPNESGWTLFHLACFYGDSKRVSRLKQLCDINARIKSSLKTGLMIACEEGHEEVCRELLRTRGLKKNFKDTIVGSALDWACEFGHVNICKLLVENGFDKQSEVDKVKLLRSACSGNRNDLINLFLNLWSWEETNEKGNTALHLLCESGSLNEVKILISHGEVAQNASVKRNNDGKTARELALINGHNDILAVLNRYGITA